MIKPLPGSTGFFPPFVPPATTSASDPFQSITHSPSVSGAPMAPVKPFGTSPISQPGLAPPSSLFAPLAEQISRQDVFFSDQSFRAQLHRYLNVMPSSPWMFAYARQATSSWLDNLVTPRQSVLLITPVAGDEADSGSGSQQQKENENASDSESSQPERDAEAADILAVDVLDERPSSENASKFDNVDEQDTVSEQSTVSVVVTETLSDESGKPTRMVMQQLFGHYLDAQHYAQLTEAYEKTKDYPDQCLWVRHFQDHLEILGPQPPYQHGLHQVKRETLQAVMDWVSPFACRYLECYEDDMQLFLPNGGMLPLRPLAWVDGEDRLADVFRVKRMPNGMWFKVESVRRQTSIPIQDVAQIKRTMEEWNQTLEDVGWLRHAS